MPTEEKVTRKLRAILSADVKGYSLLMSDDEAFTVKTLKSYRALMSEQIELHTGRVVDTPGDNLLAEFASVVDAVQCAVKIQKTLKEKNEDLPLDKRLEFRIGVNIGDVIQDGESLYGKGVNIAARIEGLADPGGVCISRNAYDHISNKLSLGYEYLGEHSVKNIKGPVRVYKILTAPEDAGKLIGDVPKPVANNWIWATIVVAAVVIAVVATLVYQKKTAPEFEPASIEKMAYQLPDKPSIAVLPFDNLSGDPEQEYFSDGLTEEIITAFSKVPGIFVIARNSTFTYKGKPVKVQQVAEELGVRYVLEGSVRKGKDKVRITAQLIDALSQSSFFTS
ncbi:MAG: adenylate/guanylate cyclase domain-containing protein [Nitrospinales bacterium]